MQATASPDDTLSTRRWLALALLLLTGLALIGLAATRFGLFQTGPGAGDDATLTVITDELAFDSATLRAAAGEPLTLSLRNAEFLPHSFDIDVLDVHAPMAPRGDSTLTLPGLPAGTYTFYCAVPGHREAGMAGTLIVTVE